MSDEVFLQAVRAASGDCALHEIVGAAEALCADERVADAELAYRVWLAFHPEDRLAHVAHFNRADLLGKVGEAAGAEAALRATLALNPAFAPASINLAIALAKRGGAQEAVDVLTAALAHVRSGPFAEYASMIEAQLSGLGALALRTPAERIAALAMSVGQVTPVVSMRDAHDIISELLCRRTLDADAKAGVLAARGAVSRLTPEAGEDTELGAWERHYSALLDAVDLESVFAPTPTPRALAAPAVWAEGRVRGWSELPATRAVQDAQVIFFAAADEAYVDLYARWYARSVIKHCDVPFAVIVHVIGGGGDLARIAAKIGVNDPRLILTGDDFDTKTVAAACYDAPPAGRAKIPLAHLQSVRFQRLGGLIAALNKPVFVSDIDLLLQRGVSDLLERCETDDIVLNENEASVHYASRYTANLLLVRPTAHAQKFMAYFADFLDRMLARPAVSRWIDQVALLFARHHLAATQAQAKIGYFDTKSDINNVMYRTMTENPFRFLSLYHGFDTSSLEEEAQPARLAS